jgi:acyl carrier protein
MFEKIQELIAEGLGVDKEQVTMTASFKDDLQADSLDLFEMVMSLEEEFGVEIPTEELNNMVTVEDVIKYIEARQ